MQGEKEDDPAKKKLILWRGFKREFQNWFG